MRQSRAEDAGSSPLSSDAQPDGLAECPFLEGKGLKAAYRIRKSGVWQVAGRWRAGGNCKTSFDSERCGTTTVL